MAQQVQGTGLHEVVLFDKTTGLMDSFDPIRAEEGAVVRAENVVVDFTGAIKRREGMVALNSLNCHSLFSCGSYGLGVFDDVLCLIERDLSLTSLVSVIGSGRMSYALGFDGMYDSVFFCNGTINGKVVNKQYSAWTTGAYVGVASTDSKVIEYLPAPPIGKFLDIFNGRMFVAVDNLIYFSDPFDYSKFQYTPFLFESNVQLMIGVTGGMYVGTEDEVLFLGGNDPYTFTRSKVITGRVVVGSCVKVTASDIGLQAKTEVVVFSVSGDGIYIGSGDGAVQNLTKVGINFPDDLVGAAVVTDEQQYIISMGV